jgi:hypothetical protein
MVVNTSLIDGKFDSMSRIDCTFVKDCGRVISKKAELGYAQTSLSSE